VFGQGAARNARLEAERQKRLYEGTEDPRYARGSGEHYARAGNLESEGSPQKGPDFANASMLYWVLWLDTQDVRALDRSIETGRAAVARLPDPHAWGYALMILGMALTAKFKVTRESPLLIEALNALRAVVAAPTMDTETRTSSRIRLADALGLANTDMPDVSLLAEAVTNCRLAAGPDGKNRRAALRLTRHLRTLADATDDPSPLDEAEKILKWLAEIRAPKERMARMIELAHLYERRFDFRHNPSDLDSAVDVCREAIETPGASPELLEQATATRDRVAERLREAGNGLPLPPQ
jgi:hypothetical protein